MAERKRCLVCATDKTLHWLCAACCERLFDGLEAARAHYRERLTAVGLTLLRWLWNAQSLTSARQIDGLRTFRTLASGSAIAFGGLLLLKFVTMTSHARRWPPEVSSVVWSIVAVGAMGGWVIGKAMSKRVVRLMIRAVLEAPTKLQWPLRARLAALPREFLKSAVDPVHLLLPALAVVVSLMTVAFKTLPIHNPMLVVLAASIAFSLTMFTIIFILGLGVGFLMYTEWLSECETLARRRALRAS